MRDLSLLPSSDPGLQPSLWARCFQPFSSGFHRLGSEVFTRPQYRCRPVLGHLKKKREAEAVTDAVVGPRLPGHRPFAGISKSGRLGHRKPGLFSQVLT